MRCLLARELYGGCEQFPGVMGLPADFLRFRYIQICDIYCSIPYCSDLTPPTPHSPLIVERTGVQARDTHALPENRSASPPRTRKPYFDNRSFFDNTTPLDGLTSEIESRSICNLEIRVVMSVGSSMLGSTCSICSVR